MKAELEPEENEDPTSRLLRKIIKTLKTLNRLRTEKNLCTYRLVLADDTHLKLEDKIPRVRRKHLRVEDLTMTDMDAEGVVEDYKRQERFNSHELDLRRAIAAILGSDAPPLVKKIRLADLRTAFRTTKAHDRIQKAIDGLGVRSRFDIDQDNESPD